LKWKKKLNKQVALVLSFLLLLMVVQSFPILGYTYSKSTGAEGGVSSFGVNKDGNLEISGKTLYMLVDGDYEVANFNRLLESGDEDQVLKTESQIKDENPTFLSSLVGLIIPNRVEASMKVEYSGKITYKGKYGTHEVGDFRIDGERAFCFQHSKPTPGRNATYSDPEDVPYQNEKFARAMYYGWGGDGNIFKDENLGIVVTSLVLDRLYSGGSTGKNLPQYDELWDKVQNGEKLLRHTSFTNSNLSVNVKGSKQISQSTTLREDEKAYVTFRLPSEVTLVNETTGKKQKGGTAKIYGNQKFHFEAGLNVGVKLDTGDMQSSRKKFKPLITKPIGGSTQVLGYIKTWKDPTNTARLQTQFKVREKTLDVTWKDKDSSKVFKHVKEKKPINSKYKYTPNKTFSDGDKVYERMTDKPFEGTVTKDEKHTFNYKLRRDITVNYYDVRTGDKIKNTKKYTKLRGDKYSEKHPTIKQDGYTMRYVKKTGDAESGTVGTKNITINYYYDKPLAKVQLDKVQVYTAKASEGMPVRVYLSKDLNYKSSVADMSKKKIAVGLYLNDDLIEKKTYTANSLPEQFDFKVPSNKLKVNSKDRYEVKFQDYDKNDFDVREGYSSLALYGWSANEGTKKINVEDTQSRTNRYVVMTEITPTTNMKKYVETFTVSASPLEDSKSGYGLPTDFRVDYTNDLGKDYQFATGVDDTSAIFKADEGLVEETLNYEVKDGMLQFDLEMDNKNTSTNNQVHWDQTFQFPHMNSEKMSGNLFTDEQVAANDPALENETRDGGNKFYSPIWAEIRDYDLQYQTNKMGANKVTYELSDNWNIYAQMIATMDSKTIEDDAILFIPIDKEDPFPNGLPFGFTQADVDWIQSDFDDID
jgi:hypothetical protein